MKHCRGTEDVPNFDHLAWSERKGFSRVLTFKLDLKEWEVFHARRKDTWQKVTPEQKPRISKGTEWDVNWAAQAIVAESVCNRSGGQESKIRWSPDHQSFYTADWEFTHLTAGQRVKFFNAGAKYDHICFKAVILQMWCLTPSWFPRHIYGIRKVKIFLS